MSRTPRHILLTFALSLAACGGVPALEGTWEAGNVVFESDECAFELIYEIDEDWTEDYALAHGDERGTFTLTATPDNIAYCTVGAEPAFSCTGTVVTDYNEGEGELPPLDAVITVDGVTEGEFVGDSAATATTTFTGDCEGDACDALLGSIDADIPSPCTSVAEIEYSLVE